MLLIMFVTLAILGAVEAPFHEAKLVFPPENYHNHSPSIVETAGGDFLVSWFRGVGERTDDTSVIRGARLKPGAAEWSEPFVMADNRPLPDQNPTMFIDPQGRLWLFWISSIDNLVRGYFPMYRISTDYGNDGPPRWQWQSPLWVRPVELEETYVSAVDRMLAEGRIPERRIAALEEKKKLAADKLLQRLGWMPRQPPIMLSETRMMVPLYSDVWNHSLMAFTEDAGENWEFSKLMILSSYHNEQASLVRRKNGNIVAFMRASPRVKRAESSDGGMTWVEDPLEIPTPDSSVAAVALGSGNWLLAVNDTDEGRHVLTVYLSDDEGATWKWKRALERFDRGEGAGHYPTLIEASDGSVHIVYTHFDNARFGERMRTIKHVRFNEAWVKEGNLE
jgi:predicted neuraminidase